MASELELFNILMDRMDSFVYVPPIPVAYQNKPYDPDGPPTYIEALHLPNASDRMFLDGEDPEWHMGVLQLNIKTRLDKGPEEGLSIADALIAHFPSDLKLFGENGLRVQVSKRPDRRSGFPDNGAWVTPVSVRYSSSF
jgi:hypothetical protein